MTDKQIFRISYTHDDHNGHYVHGGSFNVNKEQLVRFLDIMKKYIRDHKLEDDDKIFISEIEEWRDFFFHKFGFVGYASYYEIDIYTHKERFYLGYEKLEEIDKILSSLHCTDDM